MKVGCDFRLVKMSHRLANRLSKSNARPSGTVFESLLKPPSTAEQRRNRARVVRAFLWLFQETRVFEPLRRSRRAGQPQAGETRAVSLVPFLSAQERHSPAGRVRRGGTTNQNVAYFRINGNKHSPRTTAPLKDASPNRGFTLVEILIALMIFAVISVLAYRATGALTDSEQRLTQEAAHWRAIEQVFTRFEADIRQALPRSLAEGKRILPPWSGQREGQRRAELQFARAAPGLPAVVASAHGQRMTYVWQQNERGGALELLYWPAFDNAPNTAPQRYLLLDGIAHFRLDYLTKDDDWIDEWPRLGEAALPRAVRMQLAGADGAVLERLFVLQ